MKERLQKYMARAGIASRRHSEEIIAAGRVKVNGAVVREPGAKIEPGHDVVTVDNKTAKVEKKVYILLNKPSGYVTTLKDPQGRPVVTDLSKEIPQRVYPVGRLDYSTEGLLLLTNDGRLAYALTHPRHEIQKIYHALVKGVPSIEKINQMKKGIDLSDGTTAPARVRIIGKQMGDTLLEIGIHEGKNRQVRRMCEHIGHPVLQLKRVKIGNLTLHGLSKGRHRHLTHQEIKQLTTMALPKSKY